MALTLSANDTGTDVALRDDVGLRWTLSSGQANVALWALRCLSADLGSLYYDRGYGFNLIGALSMGFSRTALSNLQSNVVAALTRDERIQSCRCVATPNSGANSLTVTVDLETAAGPFRLVLLVTNVGVLVLSGTTAAAAPVTPAGAVAPSFAGPPGPPGVPGTGTPGPSGSPGAAGTFSQSFTDNVEQADDSGSERVWWQFTADLSAQPAGTLNAIFTMLARSAGGVATFRLYVGGAYSSIGGTPGGGTLIDQKTTSGGSFADLKLSNTFTNPTGVVPVQVTIQSSANGVDAAGSTVNGNVFA